MCSCAGAEPARDHACACSLPVYLHSICAVAMSTPSAVSQMTFILWISNRAVYHRKQLTPIGASAAGLHYACHNFVDCSHELYKAYFVLQLVHSACLPCTEQATPASLNCGLPFPYSSRFSSAAVVLHQSFTAATVLAQRSRCDTVLQREADTRSAMFSSLYWIIWAWNVHNTSATDAQLDLARSQPRDLLVRILLVLRKLQNWITELCSADNQLQMLLNCMLFHTTHHTAKALSCHQQRKNMMSSFYCAVHPCCSKRVANHNLQVFLDMQAGRNITSMLAFHNCNGCHRRDWI